jgi:hypothetical protein
MEKMNVGEKVCCVAQCAGEVRSWVFLSLLLYVRTG